MSDEERIGGELNGSDEGSAKSQPPVGGEEKATPEDPYQGLRAKLAAFQKWPGEYTFKFIVPEDRLGQVEAVFDGAEVSTRPSRTGKYVSLTCTMTLESSEAVIDVYKKTEGIPGLIAL